MRLLHWSEIRIYSNLMKDAVYRSTKMTKAKLEEMGRNHGIELDRRLTKDLYAT